MTAAARVKRFPPARALLLVCVSIVGAAIALAGWQCGQWFADVANGTNRDGAK